MKNSALLSEMAKTITPYQWAINVAPEVLRFDTNTLPKPPPSVQILLKILKENCPINEYGDPSYSKLKKLVSKYEGVGEEMLTITNSGDEALDVIAKAFLNPGDLFLIQPPTYEIFRSQCEINRGKAIEVPLMPGTYMIDIDKVKKTIENNQIKIIFICSPNNPTGTVTPIKTVEEIAKVSCGIILVDEAYREFWGETAVPLLKKFPNVVILRSFSKFGAMAGARVGYLIASRELSRIFDSIRFPLGVSYFSAKLAEILLENDQEWIKKQSILIRKERTRLTNRLTKLGLLIYPSQANFLLVKIGAKAEEVCRQLKKRNILVRDRSTKKYLEGCIRVTVRSRKENNILIKNLNQIL